MLTFIYIKLKEEKKKKKVHFPFTLLKMSYVQDLMKSSFETIQTLIPEARTIHASHMDPFHAHRQ